MKEALETLEAYAAFGKPVVIEETFPLKCDLESFREFLTKAQSFAAGGISFYWGAPQEGNAQANNPLAAAITAKWLEMFRELTPTVLPQTDETSGD